MRPLIHRKNTTIARNVLVLSGGGLHGAVQAGMLQRLVRSGWQPDAIVGVSAGALNGSWIANNWNEEGVDRLVDIWAETSQQPVFHRKRLPQMYNLVRGKDSLQQSAALEAVIDTCVPVKRLEHCTISLHVGAVDVESGSTTWFTNGDAHTRLLASAAVPGLIAPVTIDGHTYVDGGVISNVPARRAVELGARNVVICDVSDDPALGRRPKGAIGVVLHSYAMARKALAAADIDYCNQHVTHVSHIEFDVPDDLRPDDWHRANELAEIGRAAYDQWELTCGHHLQGSKLGREQHPDSHKVRERVEVALGKIRTSTETIDATENVRTVAATP